MIVQLHSGAALELFWRYPGVRPWSTSLALDFLRRFNADRDKFASLRRYLSEYSSPAAIAQWSDEDVLQAVAAQIGAGQLIIAEYGINDRRPATGTLLGSGWNSVLLLRRSELRPDRHVGHAMRWLKSIEAALKPKKADSRKDSGKPDKTDDTAEIATKELALLGAVFANSSSDAGEAGALDNAFVLRRAERTLLSGELIVLFHSPPAHKSVVDEAPVIAAVPPPRSAPDREPIVDPDTFDSDSEPSAQAASLINAAENGVAFCVVCQRQARGAA